MIRRLLPHALIAGLAAALLTACAVSARQHDAPATSAAPATASAGMVAAANPLAAQAGLDVLKRGGTAVDAAVAIQAVLSLVEPQSSGVGGGAFMVHYDGRTGAVTAWDGRETAPAGATEDMFLGADGKPLPYREAVVSGRATGVPGAIAMLAQAQGEHGRLPWNSLFEAGKRHAREGFVVSPRLSKFINSNGAQQAQPDVRAYFTEADGTLMEAGDRLANPAYAETLEAIAADPRALYEGPLAEQVAARTRQAPLPGTLTAADLAAYRPRSAAALCRPWKVYRLCTTPPPSSGVSVLQGLLMLERTPAIRGGASSADAWLAFVEASRLMYADRDRWVADPAFVDVPVEGLLSPAYVARRAALIGPRFAATVEAGTPPGAPARIAADRTLEPAGTSHFVVVDRWGNAVSMTTTVESIFGTGRMVGGFFLNNQLTDFSFSPAEADGRRAANAVAPGKRPRSSMSPIIVLDRQGRFVAALGSPGGSAILAYNLKTAVGLFEWNLGPQAAIDLPNVIARGNSVGGEAAKLPPQIITALSERGVTIKPGAGEESGLHAVVRRGGQLEGGADPRREGVVLGEQVPAMPASAGA